MSLISVYITTAGHAEARKISNLLVRKKLVACANIIDGIESVYRWKGKVEHSRESIIIAKTQKKHLELLTTVVKSIHSYENPCIVSSPVQGGNLTFLKWIKENT